jgi:BirA family biotin operon repressor/biotin-[acetyl-CoA-carboxylase] ligase
MSHGVRRILLESAGTFVAEERLGAELGSGRSALGEVLDRLREEGYEMESCESRGVRLLAAPDLLNPKEVEASLSGARIGRRILYRREVASTSDEVRELADAGEEEGTVVVADRQTHGRGRGAHSWHSLSHRGLWLSILLRPPVETRTLGRVTCTAGVAVVEGLRREWDLPALIKWPNDVWIRERKVAGILTEMRSAGRRPGAVVLGLGLNVNHGRDEFPGDIRETATSMRLETGKPLPRTEILAGLLASIGTWYAKLLAGDIVSIEERFREWSLVLGRTVRLRIGGEVAEGRVRDLSCADGVTLELPGGGVRNFRSEHISLVELTD